MLIWNMYSCRQDRSTDIQIRLPLTERLPQSQNLGTDGNFLNFIGRNMGIMSGVTIGEGSVIGANSVVIKDMELFSVVVVALVGKIN